MSREAAEERLPFQKRSIVGGEYATVFLCPCDAVGNPVALGLVDDGWLTSLGQVIWRLATVSLDKENRIVTDTIFNSTVDDIYVVHQKDHDDYLVSATFTYMNVYYMVDVHFVNGEWEVPLLPKPK